MSRKHNKILLLEDLCARLPYDVICKVKYTLNNETTYGEDIEKECTDVVKRINFDNYTVYTEWLGYESDIEDIKPYLRPMSSMTEEEFTELKNFTGLKYDQLELVDWNNAHRTIEFYLEEIPHYCVIKVFDWLNAHHFDYRGLIEKGLALEAPEGMYSIKEK